VGSPSGRGDRRGGTTEAADIEGRKVVVFHVQGAKSGTWRKIPLMRVEHGGTYAAVASMGGAPQHPQWYWSMKANPHVDVQDGTALRSATARLATPDERAQWWPRCVAAFPNYADYAKSAGDREIPVFLVTPEANSSDPS
jgi:deazaflavin-dependent oxidoreductase (nitroreductase family)